MTYTLSVNNGGPNPALGVVVTDTLPANAAFISATPSQGSCTNAGDIVTCSLGGHADGFLRQHRNLNTAQRDW